MWTLLRVYIRTAEQGAGKVALAMLKQRGCAISDAVWFMWREFCMCMHPPSCCMLGTWQSYRDMLAGTRPSWFSIHARQAIVLLQAVTYLQHHVDIPAYLDMHVSSTCRRGAGWCAELSDAAGVPPGGASLPLGGPGAPGAAHCCPHGAAGPAGHVHRGESWEWLDAGPTAVSTT
jgi:hypothetical protein